VARAAERVLVPGRPGTLPGEPLHTLDGATLDALLGLVELQADQAPRLGEGGWDISWWIGVVLFEGWEHWWDSAQPAARSPGWWTGTTSGLAAAPPTLPGCCFDWHRLHLAGEQGLAPDGAERLVHRIVEIAGDQGLRCVVGYGAVARLGLAAQRHEPDALQTWRRVSEALLDALR